MLPKHPCQIYLKGDPTTMNAGTVDDASELRLFRSGTVSAFARFSSLQGPVRARQLSMRRTLIVSLNPGECGACDELKPDLAIAVNELAAVGVDVVYATAGSWEQALARFPADAQRVIVDETYGMALELLGLTVTPSAIVLENARVVAGPGIGVEAVRTIIRNEVGDGEARVKQQRALGDSLGVVQA